MFISWLWSIVFMAEGAWTSIYKIFQKDPLLDSFLSSERHMTMLWNSSNRRALLSHQDDGKMLPSCLGVFNLHKNGIIVTETPIRLSSRDFIQVVMIAQMMLFGAGASSSGSGVITKLHASLVSFNLGWIRKEGVEGGRKGGYRFLEHPFFFPEHPSFWVGKFGKHSKTLRRNQPQTRSVTKQDPMEPPWALPPHPLRSLLSEVPS